MTRPPTGPTGRKLGQKVKRKSKLKASSRRWIERHLNDPYVQQAKQEGYRSRAVYKLLEIDAKHKILDKARRIIDLGAAPGGWSQISAQVTDSTDEDPKVVAIDFLEMDGLAGVKFLQMDFLDDAAPQGAEGRARRCSGRGLVRHGRADHRPPAHRSPSGRCICARWRRISPSRC
jgi:23S rRNA (uridine2552-2'-O)-methyltransferase